MEPQQAIKTPFGISVFGSAVIRVAPDYAAIRVTVSRLEPKPDTAFAKTRQGAQAVRECLRRAGITDFRASRLTLSHRDRYGVFDPKGYQARVSFYIILRDLDRIEELLTTLIAAGASEVEGVEFQTSRLKEVRADARRRAVAAAQDKAANYGGAAGVSVGAVLHIEDVNPNVLRGYEGHVTREPQYDDSDDGDQALDPGAISIGAAVLIAYEIRPR